MSIYTQYNNRHSTPQTDFVPGVSNQTQNSAGGVSFALDDFARLQRFLILGSEGGSYYATEKTLTLDNCEVVRRCLKADGQRTVQTIVEISDAGRAYKNDPAIFALALALKVGDLPTRRLAAASVQKVCRTGTHILQFAEAIDALGGWGRLTKKAVAAWFTERKADNLANLVIKYRQRNGRSMRDLLRQCHARAEGPTGEVLAWVARDGKRDAREVRRKSSLILERQSAIVEGNLPLVITGFEALQRATSDTEAAALIAEYGLPRECVPTQFLNSPKVWAALLHAGNHGMGLTAMIRSLGKMTSIGFLTPGSAEARYVTSRLGDLDAIRAQRVHPIQFLMANRIYNQGKGDKGSLTWTPVTSIRDSLEEGFYSAFKTVTPTGKVWELALDVSGSMASGQIAGTGLTPRVASVAMALVTANTESEYYFRGFSNTYLNLDARISKYSRLGEAQKAVGCLPFASTDCSLPMENALQERRRVDVFAVYTDSETYAGRRHPFQALEDYRQKMGIDAKLIVVGMVSNGFTIANPADPGMLDVVGFDSNTPSVMAEFAKG